MERWHKMNPLDWLLAILLVYSVVRAALQGFARAVLTLLGSVAGFLLACWYYRELALHLSGLISSQPVAQLSAFLLILCGCIVVANLLGKLLHRAASATGLGFVNRLLGALFGAVRGFLIGTAILTAVTAFLPTAPWITNSEFAPYFLRAAHAVSFVMPTDLKTRLHDGVERVRRSTPDWFSSPRAAHTK